MILKCIKYENCEKNKIPSIERTLYLDYVSNLEVFDDSLDIYSPSTPTRERYSVEKNQYTNIYILNDKGQTIEKIK